MTARRFLSKIIPAAVKTRIRNFIIPPRPSVPPVPKTLEQEELEMLWKKNRYEPCEVTLFGTKIRILDSESYIFQKNEILVGEIYKFNSNLESPFIIDCGANIGLSTIYFKRIFPQAKVIAFEPDKRVFDVLHNNLQQFGFNDVELVPKGVWSSETVLTFFSEGSDAGRIAQGESAENEIQINTTLLSSYLDREVDLLKLDIEGAEFEVLRECSSHLHNVKNIFVEFHSFSGREQLLSEILAILKKAGFRVNISSPGLHSAHPFIKRTEYLGMDMQLNIFGYRL